MDVSDNQHDPRDNLVAIVQSLVKAIPCRNGSIVEEALVSNNDKGVFNTVLDYNTDPNSFRDSYLFQKVVSKYPALNLQLDTGLKALETFVECETTNKQTNRRLRFDEMLAEGIPPLLVSHAEYVRKVLGKVGPQLEDILSGAYFGPGSVIGTSNNKTALTDKVHGKWTCTPELVPFARHILNAHPMLIAARYGLEHQASLIRDDVVEVVGAKLTFVPKNAKTDRSITVEPLINSFIQNGIGKHMRRLLKLKTSLRLDDQKKNAKAASTAWKDGWATLDLSNASNTLSYGLVERSLSLAPDWLHLLNLTRSRMYTFKKTTARFEMFSGMGNGFTFPLESLIFYSLARSVMRKLGRYEDPIVYGDDLIVPNDCVSLLTHLLDQCGLKVNLEKSFSHDHPFRESCGEHYLKGITVKPFQLAETLDNDMALLRCHNRIWEWACQDGITFDTRVVPTLKMIRGLMHDRAPIVHPQLGDVGLYPLVNIGHRDTIRSYDVWGPINNDEHYRGWGGFWCNLTKALQCVDGSQPNFGSEFLATGRGKLGQYDQLIEGVPTQGRFSPRSLGRQITYKRRKIDYQGYVFPFLKIAFV